MKNEKNRRALIKELAWDCTNKYEEREALTQYGYRQNTALMCKKLMIALVILVALIIAVVILVLILSLPLENVIEKGARNDLSDEGFLFIPIIIIGILVSVCAFSLAICLGFVIYRVWRVVSSFDVFGTCVEKTRRTEEYVELRHVGAGVWEAEKKERDAYDGELGELFVYLLLWLTACVWVWFYYLWVRIFSVEKCRTTCSEESFNKFSVGLKKILFEKSK